VEGECNRPTNADRLLAFVVVTVLLVVTVIVAGRWRLAPDNAGLPPTTTTTAHNGGTPR
jgi:hypothetical protein